MNGDELLSELAAVDVAVATLAGIKAKFIGSGWSEPNAEALVVEMYRAQTGVTR